MDNDLDNVPGICDSILNITVMAEMVGAESVSCLRNAKDGAGIEPPRLGVLMYLTSGCMIIEGRPYVGTAGVPDKVFKSFQEVQVKKVIRVKLRIGGSTWLDAVGVWDKTVMAIGMSRLSPHAFLCSTVLPLLP
ncbi:hypothetical protein DOTSEDRAFT_39128 [Dothistroma septosporum NZE10]|uniref:Uncharacterized protein n=1 Tax=Dothistroma septosporum (strain NZE10 / CBS 128990) TaxID=675120 RepID=M2XHK7_DOTSN|nr:hypothetical protein DOTSEDRAFT_39128 [Dothistroma septosporum NZE10]